MPVRDAPAEPSNPDGLARDWIFCDMVVEDLPEVIAIERASFPNPWTGALFLQELQVAFSRTILRASRDGSDCGLRVPLARRRRDPRVERRRRSTMAWTRARASLMHEVLREARACDAVAVTLEVRRSNVAGRRLYESLGFEEVGCRPNYYGRGEDALILRLALADG